MAGVSLPLYPSISNPLPMDVDEPNGQVDGNAPEKRGREYSKTSNKRNHSTNSDVSCASRSDGGEDNEFSNLSAEEKLVKGLAYKCDGNEYFKQSDNVQARDAYLEGLKWTKELSTAEAQELKKSLNLNLSMAHIRLGEWFAAIQTASDALQLEPNNLKALYRRGYARSQYGLLNEAKADLSEVLRLDDSNADAKREMMIVKQKLVIHREQNKKAFGGLFNKTAGLYEDREKEMAVRKKKEEEEKIVLQEEWKKEMDERKEKDEGEIPFDTWAEDRKKKSAQEEEELRKKEEAARKEEQKKNTAAVPTTSRSAGDSGLDELDDEDKKVIDETKKMGYCYFRRELTEKDKMLNAQNRPQRLDGNSGGYSLGDSQHTEKPESEKEHESNRSGGSNVLQKSLSSWNAGGTTYEEKDMTNWAQERFQHHLMQASVTRGNEDLFKDPAKILDLLKNLNPKSGSGNGIEALTKVAGKLMKGSINATKIFDLSGEAHVAVIRGTKRYLFEFHCKVLFEVVLDLSLPDMGVPVASPVDKEASVFKYKGELNLPEVASAVAKGAEWLNDSRITFTSDLKPEHKEAANSLVEEFKQQVVGKIQAFLDEYTATA